MEYLPDITYAIVSAADSANYFSNKEIIEPEKTKGLSCGFCKLLLKLSLATGK